MTSGVEGTSAEGTALVDLVGQRVVVTGGSGFIGGHVVAALCRLGAQVVSVDRRPAKDFRCHPDGAHDVKVVLGDLQDNAVVEEAVEPGTRAIAHMAAQTQVLRSIEDPEGTFANNVVVTDALLERARQVGATSFVLASTNAVVGAGASGTLHEGVPLTPLTPYGATKAAGEMVLSCYNAAYGVRGVALRFTNVYGPGMSEKDSIVPRLMRAAGDGGTFTVYGDGRQVRDYVNVADVVSAILLGLRRPGLSGPLVIGSGLSVSVLDLVQLVENALGYELKVEHVPAKPGEMPAVIVDNSAARRWGWAPSVSLEEGLAEVAKEWGTADGTGD
ncbi:MAG TPA: NAD-dependent epimerase/dehydratase family protein [Acidimicrobiales bacterium]|nr:NAD-dependent epimerase/dehydratase family protein [Acidimicrobiales bacterium]